MKFSGIMSIDSTICLNCVHRGITCNETGLIVHCEDFKGIKYGR